MNTFSNGSLPMYVTLNFMLDTEHLGNELAFMILTDLGLCSSEAEQLKLF